jgi:hypothetical protein
MELKFNAIIFGYVLAYICLDILYERKWQQNWALSAPWLTTLFGGGGGGGVGVVLSFSKKGQP